MPQESIPGVRHQECSHGSGLRAPWRVTTPLQIERHLSRALEEGYQVRQKPVSAELIDPVIAKDIDDLEPRLTRQGYHMKALAELLNAKPAAIRLFLRGQLATGRTQELHSGLLAAGIPL